MTDVKNIYETVFIVSAKLGDEGNAETIERFKALIAEHGTVENVDEWGKRKLAYPINKEGEGYYTLINFTSTPDFTAELDRRFQLSDRVLRSMIIKKDPKQMAKVKAAAEKAKKQAEADAAPAADVLDVENIAVEAVDVTESDSEPQTQE